MPKYTPPQTPERAGNPRIPGIGSGGYMPTAPTAPGRATDFGVGGGGGGGGYYGADTIPGRYDTSQTFGPQGPGNPYSYEGRPQGTPQGAGVYDLPGAFDQWSAAARFAIPIAAGYESGLSPFVDYLKGEMGRNLEGDLFSRSADIIDTNAREGRRVAENEFTRSGYRGAQARSPFMALQLQLEQAARGGALGSAARSSMLQAQASKLGIGRSLQQNLASLAQAYLTPAQLQAGAVSRTPVGSVGPSYVPAAVDTLSSLIGAGAGA